MEEYRNIKGYEGRYLVNNNGDIYSKVKKRLLKPCKSVRGYMVVTLDKKTRKVHQLVAMAFLNHEPCGMKLVVNHIDFNKTNNNVNNLEVVTTRENSNLKHIKSSSKYVGVGWHKRANKWQAEIFIDRKKKYLGLFADELKASEAYQIALNNL
tara:strand:+ start:101 stop:559 length:459 start_codon:yes stop_codon:yes gene_type:complete